MQDNMKTLIFSGGIITDYSFVNKEELKKCFIISADGGYRHLLKLDVKPDVFIGDKDSCKTELPKDIKVIACPEKKDYTDTKKCVDYAIDNGATQIDIYGGLYGRLDHEYANICLLAYGLERGIRIRLLDRYNEIFMMDKPFSLKKGMRKYVSFFPFGSEVKGLSLKGFKYGLCDVTLTEKNTNSSSNEFLSDTAYIEFKSGKLLVMLCDDIDK